MDTRRQVKTQGTRSREWTNAHILLVIIVLQAGFMIFMAVNGPTGSFSVPGGAPDQALEKHNWSSGGNQRNKGGGHKSRNIQRADRKAEKLPDVVPEIEEPLDKPMTAKEPPRVEQKKPPITKIPRATNPPQYKNMVQVKEWEVSTEEFPGAIHLHLAEERQDPSFRRELKVNHKRWEEAEKAATQLLVKKKQTIKSCQYYHSDGGKSSNSPPSLRLMESCFSRKNGIIVYNTQSFSRIWCGKTIAPGAVQHYRKQDVCGEPARILLESDKMLGTGRADLKHLPPVVFHRNNSNAKVESVQDCDVPCKFTMDTCEDSNGKKQKGPDCLTGVSDFTVEGTDFAFKYSMMDPRDAPEVWPYMMKKGHRDRQFYATRSFASEIPLSTFDWDKYGENAPKNDFKKGGQKGICFIHLEPCASGEIRAGVWAGKVQEAFKGNFDAYGPCSFPEMTMKKTKTKIDVYNYKDRQKIMSEYMFTLVIGQSQTPDYVQEMVWDALQAGSIPVYFGAPNIKEHVPPNSIISGSEFPSREALAEYLEKVMKDQSQWGNYHAWREEDTQHLEQKYGFLKEKSSSPYCRMCRYVLATKYALGWNPVTQTIQPPAVDRTLCVNPKDEVKCPFLEQWMSNWGKQEPKGRKICDKSSATQTMTFDDISVTRTVMTHDNGVIDMEISDIQSLRDTEKIVLRLNFQKGIQNVEGAHILHPHQVMASGKETSQHVPLMSSIVIQDRQTRVTVLTNWVTDLMTPKFESTIDVLIQDLKKAKDVGPEDPETGFRSRVARDDVRRIRVIMEDVNLLRDVSTEYSTSSYASVMMKDFLDPLIHFYIE